MTVYLIVGLPGAGKTTRAKELAATADALRLTPDDWLQAVFDRDTPGRWRTSERMAQRDRMEGKLLEIGMQAAQRGVSVVFDFGFWSRDERSALRWIAGSLGVETEVVYLPVELAEQRRRIADRYRSRPGHFKFTDADLEQWQAQLEVPGPDELDGDRLDPPPSGFATWWRWASTRWPTLPQW